MTDGRPAGGRITARQLELLRRMRERGEGRSGASDGPETRSGGPPPRALSPGESQLWFLAGVAPAGAEYHVPLRIELPAGVGAGRSTRAVASVVARHEALRTSFPAEERGDGRPVRRVAPAGESAGPAVAVADLAALPAERVRAERARLGAAEAVRPFDLRRGPLHRALLVLSDDSGRSVLYWTFHHAVVDGASLEILLGELDRFLRGTGEAPPPPAPRLSDWVAEQARWLAGDEARAVRERRRRELDGTDGYLDLPFDRAPSAGSTTAGGTVPVTLTTDATEALEALARDHGATPFMVGCALYAALLARLVPPDDRAPFGIGVAVANRLGGDDRSTVGLLANMSVVRADPHDATAFVDLLRRIREASLNAFAAQRYPFERLVEELGPPRRPGRNPIFQVSYSLRPTEPWSDWRGGADDEGLRVTETVTPAAKFDLSLDLWRTGERFEGRLWYRSDLFDRTTAGRIARSLAGLAREAAGRPLAPLASLSALAAAERHQVATEWAEGREVWRGGDPERLADGFPRDTLLPERIAAWARREPERVALVAGRSEITYGDLLARADALAWQLSHAGLGPESRVGVCLERGASLLTALLGVQRSGAAYVPLDPAYPRERIAYMLEDSGVRWVVTDGALAEELEWPEGPEAPRLLRIDALGRAGGELGVERWPGTLPVVRDPDHLSHVIYTSGSTGRPKGVGIRHGGVLSLLAWAAGVYDDEELSGVLAATSVCFDLSVFEIFVPLALGGRVILAENALSLPGLPARDEVRLVNTVPSALGALLRSGDGLPPGVRTVNLAGEALHGELARQVRERGGVERLFNLYGPSEDTTYSTGWEVLPGDAAPAIGRSLPGTRALVLGPGAAPVPTGTVGELCLAGAGLARGYLGRPGRTAESFVPDPSGIVSGGRVYRTGDRVRWRRDGSLEFLGRRDGQVKVRGFRIELGEVEAALVEHPAVAEAAALVVRGEVVEDARLIGYVAVPPGAGTSSGGADSRLGEEILRSLRRRLPNSMVPSRLIVLPSLPHTPSGKIDRRALPRPEGGWIDTPGDRPGEPGAAGGDPLEELIAGVWADLLGARSVAPDDDFFSLGGHSLQVPIAVARVSRLLGAAIDLGDAFRHPTVAGWARLVDRARPERAGARREPPLPTARDGRLPLGFAQRRVWFLDRLEPGDPSYNLPLELALAGPLEPARLARALADFDRRHEALRTRFREEAGEPFQEVVPLDSADLGALPLVDLSCLGARAGAESTRWGRELARRPFDLAAGPPVRRVLLRRAAQDHSLVQVVHHAVWDGGSTAVLLRELEALYAGRSLPVPALQLGDFAHWQRRTLAPEALESELEHWESRLAGLDPLDLPGDRPRPATRTPRGGSVAAPLPAGLADRVRSAGRRHGASAFMVALAAFAALLHRYAGGSQGLWHVGIGTPVSGRDRPELEDVVGFLAETLVLRVELDPGARGADLLARARETVLDAFAHRDVPFDLLVDRLRPERDLARSPLFQVMLVVGDDPPAPVLSAGDACIETTARAVATGTAKFDLGLALDLSSDPASGGAGSLEYSADLFDRATARRMLRHALTLLSALADDPEAPLAALPLLEPAECHQLVGEWGEGREVWRGGDPSRLSKPAGALVPERIDAWRRRGPDRVALQVGRAAVSYAELLARVDLLARRLREAGVKPESRVGVFLERGAPMVVALLGVWGAGGAYVPLDPAYPRQRLEAMLEDSGARWVVTDRALAREMAWLAEPEGMRLLMIDEAPDAAPPAPAGPPPLARDPDHLALVIYTSGSTGRPKGVGIAHRGVRSLLAWAAGVLGDEELSGVLGATSISFDLSIFELFVTLALGGRVILAPDALALPTLPARGGVRLVNTVPSTLGALLRTEGGLPEGVLTVTLAGEVLHGDLARRILDHPGLARLCNLWGPSEDTTFSSGQTIAREAIEGAAPGLGRMLPGTRGLVLDPRLEPVPAGVPGEIFLAGGGLARGYLGRPARTAESFLPDPFAATPGGRIYRTGDRVRWRPDGTLEWVGRSDGQVKVRGFRIELGEVESALREHPDVTEAAVVVERGTAVEDTRLIGYAVVPGAPNDGSDERTAESILAALRQRLPKAMVPSRLVVLPSLPHTPSGKVDRRALPKPPSGARRRVDAPFGSGPPAIRDPLEELVAGLWSDLLGIEGIGPDDDFFTLGGHSLQATRVVARVKRDLGVELPLRAVFEQPTPARLAARIQARRRGGTEARAGLPDLVPDPRRPPVIPPSSAQRRLWFLDRLSPGSSAYNMPVVLRLDGDLDRGALARAVDELARRHESLRTRFEMVEDEPRLVVDPPAGGSPLRRIDLEELPARPATAEAYRVIRQESVRPFDLAQGPLFRSLLIALPGDGRSPRHLLVWVLHHTVADWWSLGILFRELDTLYRAARSGGPAGGGALLAPPGRYSDYALWQHRVLTGAFLEAEVEHWRGRLAGYDWARLPTDRAQGGDRPRRGAAGEVPLRLLPDTGDAVRRLARRLAATPFMVLVAALQALLGRLSGGLRVAVGTPGANRDRAETEGLVGFLGNTLVLRVDLADDPTFAELVTRVRGDALEAYDHAEVPFELLVERIAPERVVGRTPFFQVLVSYQQQLSAPALEGLETRFQPVPAGDPKFDLAVTLGERSAEAGAGLLGHLIYDTALWDRTTVVRFAGRLAAFLSRVAREPDRPLPAVELLSAAERAILLREGAEAAERLPDATVPEAFARVATETPDATALVCGGRHLTYGETARRAARLARWLRREAPDRDDRPVAVLMERSAEAVVAMLGVLASGAAYLPLDPAEPAVRLRTMLAEADPAAVLAPAGFAEVLAGLPAGVPVIDPASEGPAAHRATGEPGVGLGAPAPESAAYVIYTSGSSGPPKGVVVEHRQLAAYVAGFVRRAGLGAGGSYATVSSFATDLGHTAIFPALVTGGTLHVVEPDRLFDPLRLAEVLGREPVDVLKIVPSHLAAMLAELLPPAAGDLLPRRLLVLGGEAASPALLVRLTGEGGPRVLNHYGPTETTVGVATWPVGDGGTRWRGDGPVPVGRPLPGDQLRVTDRSLRPAPLGAPGELCVGGAGVARGYLHRPAATAERFVPDPFADVPGARLYRTGDRCVAGADGAVRFLGRIDDQVKIRGFRVEPGELESVLQNLDGVEDAAVVVLRDGDGAAPSIRLVALVAGAGVDEQDLRRRLRERLPEAMVPSEIRRLAAVPRTAAGKRDRKALERLARSAPFERAGGRRDHSAGPPGPLHPDAPDGARRRLTALWRRLLPLDDGDEIGLEDNFFDLGGHSLLLVRLQGLLRRELGVEVAVVDLFAHPTVASQARLLSGLADPGEVLAPDAAPRLRSAGVAVIGMAGRFPGARNVEELWRNLVAGIESIRSFSDQEEETSRLDPALLDLPGYVNARGVLDDVEWFDADFFGFRPREAALTDPQQRVFLECAWEALEDAGHRPEDLAERAGLFAGAGANTYLQNHLFGNPAVGPQVYGMEARIGNDKDFLTTRVSYKLDLRGPSVAVQSSCSTSLVAVHMACRALLEGECDLALAGGVRIALPQATGYLYEEGGVTSPDGHCRPFDARARGMVPGNGAGVVVLRRLEDALADGDPVRAVILGSAVNNDGSRKVGYAAPSVEGQTRVIREAQRAAGIEPGSIGLVEAHGTGTALGDPIEVEALTRAMGETPPGFEGDRPERFLGSIKSNLGHLDTAAGVAGLIKTVLALERRTVPPTAHFETPNPGLRLERGGFRVLREAEPWPALPERPASAPRRAGVSSFGIGGTNAHAVLEEAPAPVPGDPPRRPRELLVLSARSRSALERRAEALTERLRSGLEAPWVLADVSHTLQTGRRAFAHRLAVYAATPEEAAEALAVARPRGAGARGETREEARVVFLFPGQGAPLAGALRVLAESEETFRAALERFREVLAAHGVWDGGTDLFDLLLPEPGDEERAAADWRETRYAQPALVAVELALVGLWEAWGVRPAAVAGHSVGELAAAAAAGVLDPETALLLAAERGRLMQGMPPGGMVAVPLGEEAVAPLVDELGRGLALAGVNAPDRVVVAGPADALDAFADRIRADHGVSCRRLEVAHAFHSPATEAALAPFAAAVARAVPAPRPPEVPWVSTLTGDWMGVQEAADPEHWARQMRGTVRFARATQRLLDLDRAVLLEVGPGRALSGFARRTARDGASGSAGGWIPTVASLPDEGNAGPFESLGELWASGIEPDWRAVRAGERRLRVPLPTYPFERRRYWFEPVLRPHLGGAWAAAAPEEPAEQERPALEADFVAPRDEVETAIAELWARLFGIARVGAEDDFFELGGDSLLATQIVAGVRERLDAEVTAAQLFEERTVAGLAVRAREALATRTSSESRRTEAEGSMDDIEALLDEVEGLGIGASAGIVNVGGSSRKGNG